MQVGDIASVVAFILPGYLAAVLKGFLVRSRKRDDFERLGTSLLFSLLAYAVVLFALYLRYPKDWLTRCAVSAGNWQFVLSLFAVALPLGLLWALLSRSTRLQRWLRAIYVYHSHHPDVWRAVWETPAGAPWVVVQLENGTECRGAVRMASGDPDDPCRELWLCPVLKPALDASGSETDEYKEVPGLSLYVPGTRILAVSIYRMEDTSA